ncbi:MULTISPECIES: CapA family protein [Chelativorans]|jgi:poly-gamma-glutamate synthesis protein (capsule biosynthesis protein)|uniref:Putative enzyme of poly-gamma-glutamate biosynthesis (Capsule formation)-like protein n=1 Tax=Chelativorans sp. (strain BNC1) TaxID=266779 RepID=Q11EZ2_CHESB|nr:MULTISPECIES: CapA family protein [Chelativorans]
MIYDAESRNMTFSLAGDVILNRAISHYKEPAFLKLIELLRSTDATLGNLESLYHNWEMPYGSNYVGAYQVGAPEMLEEIKWMGFSGMSAAMNHAFDCGEAGLMATLENCRARGLKTCGVGRSLGEARAPVYVETPKGRVALMSASTLFGLPPVAHAGPGRHDMPGKPGVAILRHKTLHTVPEAEFQSLANVHEGLGMRSPIDTEELVIAEQRYRKGREYKIETSCEQEDLQDILRYIRGARKTSDFVAFSLHCHENGTTGRYFNAVHRASCPDFLIEFCHDAIDAGCDLIFVHGPHVLRGIEIYKGKPIFYSLGNFVFNVESLERIPEPAYRRMGFDHTATAGDWTQRFADDSIWAWSKEPACYQTVLPICDFRGGELAEVVLYPVDLGYGTPTSQRGRPVLAGSDVSDEIFEFIKDVSQPFGTRFEKIEDCKFRIVL